MGKYIVKLATPDGDRYLMWSTIPDAPVTYGLTRSEFEAYYLKEFGESSRENLERRMVDVEARGTSSKLDHDPAEVIVGNRAGKGETELTMAQIVDYYCVRRGKGEWPRGRARRGCARAIDTTTEGSKP